MSRKDRGSRRDKKYDRRQRRLFKGSPFGNEFGTLFSVVTMNPNQNWDSFSRKLTSWCDKGQCPRDRERSMGGRGMDIIE